MAEENYEQLAMQLLTQLHNDYKDFVTEHMEILLLYNDPFGVTLMRFVLDVMQSGFATAPQTTHEALAWMQEHYSKQA